MTSPSSSTATTSTTKASGTMVLAIPAAVLGIAAILAVATGAPARLAAGDASPPQDAASSGPPPEERSGPPRRPDRELHLEGPTDNGTASVTPDSGICGRFGTWTVRYRAGRDGIARGGGVLVQLPDAWHAGPRNSANRLQATDPRADHYVSASCSHPGVVVETEVESESRALLVKHAKLSLDGRKERYVFVVRVRVVEGGLSQGDTLSLVYGDRRSGARGYRAAAVAGEPQPILIAVDAEGSGAFRRLLDPPRIQARPGPAVEALLHVPSLVATGEDIELLVSLVDAEENCATGTDAIEVELELLEGSLELPARAVIPAGRGFVRVPAHALAPGVARVRARCPTAGLITPGQPIEITADAPGERIYWGDLHSHTDYSWDGVGRDPFSYARNVTGLDFYAMTDHAMEPEEGGAFRRGLDRSVWGAYTALVEAHNDPGSFVTLHAYECSFGTPFGHHNVYFRGRPGPLLYPSETTLPDLWEALREGEALTIQHHTGKFPRGIDFSIHHPGLRRNFEIYSGHGLSEAYDPEHPLAFEQSRFTADSRSLDEPTHAQDVWRRGLRLSTIASSDDHRAHPGQPHYGLVAVRAPELTREAVFDALFARRTYATTGSKVLLEFTLNGRPMGSVVTTAEAPRLEIRVAGTAPLYRVELLRYRQGAAGFGVLRRFHPEGAQAHLTLTDRDWAEGDVYYVRVRQRSRVRGLPVMAWSSPIWTVGGEDD